RSLRQSYPEFGKLLEERLAQYKAKTEARIPLDFTEELVPAETLAHNKVALDGKFAVGEKEDAAAPFADDEGHFRKKKRRIRKFEHITQIDEMDCGAASLGMICRHFGRKVSLARIRQLCHTATDGTSLKALCRAAVELGLAARALKVSLRNLSVMPLPAIVHWEGNHWMVLYDVDETQVRVADPALGLRKVPRKEFEQKWSGYAALFDYTIAFEQAPESKPGMAWVWPFLAKFRKILLQVLGLAVAVSFLQLLFPVFTQMVVDKVIVENDLGLLKTIILGMLAAIIFVQLAAIAQEYLLAFAAVRLYAALMYFSLKVLRPLFAEVEERQGKYSSHQIDAIEGIEAVNAASAESVFRDAMLNEFLAVSKKIFRSNFVVMSYDSVLQTIGLLSTAIFLWVGANQVINGHLSVGGFVAFSSLTAIAYAAILRTLGVWDNLQLAAVLMNRLNDIFEQEPEQGRDRSRLTPVRSLEGRIELRNVSFRYGGPEAPNILSNITLDLAPGRMIAFVGRSGCGKTTLVKLIAGLLEPTEGTILFDHVDLKNLNYRDVRRH